MRWLIGPLVGGVVSAVLSWTLREYGGVDVMKWLVKIGMDLWPLWLGLAVFLVWSLVMFIRRIEREGGWVQIMIGRRVMWLTARAYEACYVGLDDQAQVRVNRALSESGQNRWSLAELERLAR